MKKTICVDFDGVLADYTQGWHGVDHFGDPIPGAVEFTKELSKFAEVVVFTCRCSGDLHSGLAPHLLTNAVRAYLDKHGFEYASVYAGTGKPIASAYIDDRAIFCDPQHGGKLLSPQQIYKHTIERAKEFCHVEQDDGEDTTVPAASAV